VAGADTAQHTHAHTHLESEHSTARAHAARHMPPGIQHSTARHSAPPRAQHIRASILLLCWGRRMAAATLAKRQHRTHGISNGAVPMRAAAHAAAAAACWAHCEGTQWHQWTAKALPLGALGCSAAATAARTPVSQNCVPARSTAHSTQIPACAAVRALFPHLPPHPLLLE
jgi:hypothetical protein